MTTPANKTALVVGDANFDMVLRLPPGDSEADALQDLPSRTVAGGTAGNVAKALVGLGIATRLACAVGRDGHGRFIRQALTEAGVDTRHFHITPDYDTLIITAVVDRSGQRYFARFPTFQHASSYYPPDKLTAADVARVDWLHSSGSCFDHGTTAAAAIQAMGWARQAGLPVSFDINLRPMEDGRLHAAVRDIEQAVALSDYVLGSGADEMTLLTGNSDPLEAALTLSDDHRSVIARAGARGAMVIEPSGAVTHVPAFPVTVVDTLGAGDAFDAGFVACMIDGTAVDEAARWGNAMAALTISQESAGAAITPDMLQELLGNDTR
jgi:sugar/nucleoside kinase (ribokinase family)